MTDVFATDLGVLIQSVVGLVGKADPGLPEEHDIATGIARIGLGLEVEKATDRAAGEATEQGEQLVGGGDRIDSAQRRP